MGFMKRILYIFGALVLFLVIFFLVGIVKKTVRFEQELFFDKPPKMVYYAMMNPMRMDEWIQGFQKAEAFFETCRQFPARAFCDDLSAGNR